MSLPGWQEIVRRLEMQPHPEGGYFKESYRAKGSIPGAALLHRPEAGRAYSTAIYYLLPPEGRSRLHRMKSDEIFHFYLGGPMSLVKLMPDGSHESVRLGQELADGQQLQHLVEAGTWFGGFCEPGSPFSLVGCTVAPGFEFEDFELGERGALLRQFPAAGSLIEKLLG